MGNSIRNSNHTTMGVVKMTTKTRQQIVEEIQEVNDEIEKNVILSMYSDLKNNQRYIELKELLAELLKQLDEVEGRLK